MIIVYLHWNGSLKRSMIATPATHFSAWPGPGTWRLICNFLSSVQYLSTPCTGIHHQRIIYKYTPQWVVKTLLPLYSINTRMWTVRLSNFTFEMHWRLWHKQENNQYVTSMLSCYKKTLWRSFARNKYPTIPSPLHHKVLNHTILNLSLCISMTVVILTSQQQDRPETPWAKFRKYVWFWRDQKIHSIFYNGCLWENRFWNIKRWRRHISQK